jgi:CheY-like chemotaxis protein
MSQKHILLVDDEDDIREVASISLEAIGGWRVSSASSGIEGIAKAISERPDAILLDVMMPGIDGPTTFGRLQAQPATREIPVILLTAKAQGADLRHFEELGVAGVLTKPFDPMSLPGRVAEVLAGAAQGSGLVGEAE